MILSLVDSISFEAVPSSLLLDGWFLHLGVCCQVHRHPAWIGAAFRSRARRSIRPHGPGSSLGCAEAAFLSEFLILNGWVARCALARSNQLLLHM